MTKTIICAALLLAGSVTTVSAEPGSDPRWHDIPKEKHVKILMWCYGFAGGVDGNVPDYTKQADCLERQLDGWGRVQKLLPPGED